MLKTLTWLKLTLFYTTHEAASVKVNNQLRIFTSSFMVDPGKKRMRVNTTTSVSVYTSTGSQTLCCQRRDTLFNLAVDSIETVMHYSFPAASAEGK